MNPNETDNSFQLVSPIPAHLSVNETPVCPFLTRLERTFIKAAYGKKLLELRKDTVMKKLYGFVVKAFIETGQVISGYTEAHRRANTDVIVRLVYDDLICYFPTITIDELEIAIKNGIRHAYGEYYGINAVSINQFVTKFLADAERKSAIHRQKEFLDSLVEKPREVLTPEKKDEIGNQILVQCFEQYKKTGTFIDAGKLGYEYAVQKGFIYLTNEQKCEIYEQAIEEVEIEEAINHKKNNYNKFQKKTEEQLQFEYKSKAMEISLRRYFDFMKRIEKGEIIKKIDLSKPIENQ